MIYVFLAEGFEEIEALTPVDCLRRADKTVQTVGVGGSVIKGAHGISVTADITANQIELDSKLEMIVLPGGMPGTLNLEKSAAVQSALDYCAANGRLLCAICAAPSVLGHKGYLKGKEAIAFPGFEKELAGARISSRSVVTDGSVITAKGAGVAVEFGLAVVAALKGAAAAAAIGEAIQCK